MTLGGTWVFILESLPNTEAEWPFHYEVLQYKGNRGPVAGGCHCVVAEATWAENSWHFKNLPKTPLSPMCSLSEIRKRKKEKEEENELLRGSNF